jgi:hypothetical protein
MSIQQFVCDNEFDWWVRKLTHAQVRKILRENGFIVRVKDFKDFLGMNCKVYSVWKRKPKTKQKTLCNFQWDVLRQAVDSCRPHIDGVGIEVALQVVLTKVSTNTDLLKGLPKRLYYWTKKV